MPNDRRRQRYRPKRQDHDKSDDHFVLAKRPEDQHQHTVQPKILIKPRDSDAILPNQQQENAPLKTIIIQRSTKPSPKFNAGINVNPSSSSYSYKKDEHDSNIQDQQQGEHFNRKMLRAVQLINKSGVLNYNARKVLNKNNSNFLVVGIIGETGVGKSTVMNLLARNYLKMPERDIDLDMNVDEAFYRSVFRTIEKGENVFNTKLKTPTHPRTETFHMYITSERTILIDSPPILNVQKRSMSANSEITDIKNIVNLMNTCHLLVVVYENALNMEVMRLIHLAIQTKPEKLSKLHAHNYLPSIMFVKNRAKRSEYATTIIDREHRIFRAVFGNHLNIYSTSATPIPTSSTLSSKNVAKPILLNQQQQPDKDKDNLATSRDSLSKNLESEQESETLEPINYLILPEFQSCKSSTFHPGLYDLMRQLNGQVLATTRNAIHEANQPFTELDWFETLVKSIKEGLQKFEDPLIESYDKYKPESQKEQIQHHHRRKRNRSFKPSSFSINDNESYPIDSFNDLSIDEGNKNHQRRRRGFFRSTSKT